jgi:hypothetical protein
VAPYLDEETFDIVPHVIKVESLNDRLLSPRMKSILENRKKSESMREGGIERERERGKETETEKGDFINP